MLEFVYNDDIANLKMKDFKFIKRDLAESYSTTTLDQKLDFWLNTPRDGHRRKI